MVMGMDKKTAMTILQLSVGATAGDAKKAFRKLAKAFHPDRFARDEHRARQAESRMKQINQAFYFLEPLLPKEAVSKIIPKQKKTKTPGITLSGIVKTIKEKVQSRPGAQSKTRTRAGENFSARPGAKMQKRAGREVKSFNTVLHGIEPGIELGIPVVVARKNKRRSSFCKDPLTTYKKYLTLQKKIRSRQNRSKEMGVGRIEKISRVQRINPIGED